MQVWTCCLTQEEAAEAKRRGRVLARGVPPMTIFWSSYSGGARTSDPEDKGARKRPSDGGET